MLDLLVDPRARRAPNFDPFGDAGVGATLVGPSKTPVSHLPREVRRTTVPIVPERRDELVEQSVLRDAATMSHRAVSAFSRLVLLSVLAVLGPLATPVSSSVAEAQGRPAATILRTHVGTGASEATGRGFDRVLRQRLDALGVVQMAGSVELDLESVQLALGCMGESVECLRAAATQANTEILVFASIESSGSLVVSVMRFDATEGRLRRAVRTVDSEAAVLEAAEPLARELWDLPPVASVADPVVGPVTPPSRSVSAAPIVVTAIGGAVLIGGAVSLILGASTHDAFRRSTPDTPAEVDATIDLLNTAQLEQLLGSVLLAAGGAVTIAGLIWLLAAGNEDGSSPLAVLPVVTPDQMSLTLAGTFSLGGL